MGYIAKSLTVVQMNIDNFSFVFSFLIYFFGGGKCKATGEAVRASKRQHRMGLLISIDLKRFWPNLDYLVPSQGN